jgi:hypothetical protein
MHEKAAAFLTRENLYCASPTVEQSALMHRLAQLLIDIEVVALRHAAGQHTETAVGKERVAKRKHRRRELLLVEGDPDPQDIDHRPALLRHEGRRA